MSTSARVHLGERVLVVERRASGRARARRVSPSCVRVCPSAISNATTVMLSSPPPLFAAFTSALSASSMSPRFSLDESRISRSSHHRRQPVGAEQEDVAGLRVDRERVDVDVGVGAERARDHGALRMRLRLFRRELAAAHQLGDERVVLRQLLHAPSRIEVRARVADMSEGRHCRPRRAATVIVVPIPDVFGSRFERCVHAAVRLLDERTIRCSPPASAPLSLSAAAASVTRPRRPGRRPSRRRPRRAAARRRRRPRSGACGGPGP